MAHDAFVQFDRIPSRNADSPRPGWSRLLSMRHSLEQPTAGSAAAGGASTPSRTRHGDLVIHKLVDDTSPMLALYCCSGSRLQTVTVEIWDAGAGRQKFMEYVLTNVLVRSVTVQLPTRQDVGLEATLWEAVGLQYERIEWNYSVNSADGNIGAICFYWDTSENQGG